MSEPQLSKLDTGSFPKPHHQEMIGRVEVKWTWDPLPVLQQGLPSRPGLMQCALTAGTSSWPTGTPNSWSQVLLRLSQSKMVSSSSPEVLITGSGNELLFRAKSSEGCHLRGNSWSPHWGLLECISCSLLWSCYGLILLHIDSETPTLADCIKSPCVHILVPSHLRSPRCQAFLSYYPIHQFLWIQVGKYCNC